MTSSWSVWCDHNHEGCDITRNLDALSMSSVVTLSTKPYTTPIPNPRRLTNIFYLRTSTSHLIIHRNSRVYFSEYAQLFNWTYTAPSLPWSVLTQEQSLKTQNSQGYLQECPARWICKRPPLSLICRGSTFSTLIPPLLNHLSRSQLWTRNNSVRAITLFSPPTP